MYTLADGTLLVIDPNGERCVLHGLPEFVGESSAKVASHLRWIADKVEVAAKPAEGDEDDHDKKALAPKPLYDVIKQALVERGWKIDADATENNFGEVREFVHPATSKKLAYVDAVYAEMEREP